MPAHQVDLELDQRRVVREFVRTCGTANQYERVIAGLLPEHELLALARYELFLPFASFRRWVKLDPGDVRHRNDCMRGETTFVTHEPADLTHDEWALFRKITDAVGVANTKLVHQYRVIAAVSLVEHVGRCSVCSAEIHGRSASIRIEWAGRPLSREYTLGGLR